jgi:hypothetical protein
MEVAVKVRLHIECTPEQVYDFVTSIEAPALTFEGHGLIPGVKRTEVLGGGPLTEGGICRVHGSDGSVIERLITVLERPRRHEYKLASGFKKPFSLLVKSGRGVWTFTPTPGEGTQLEWTYVFGLTSPLVLPIAYPLAKALFQQAMRKCLDRTRHCLLQKHRGS